MKKSPLTPATALLLVTMFDTVSRLDMPFFPISPFIWAYWSVKSTLITFIFHQPSDVNLLMFSYLMPDPRYWEVLVSYIVKGTSGSLANTGFSESTRKNNNNEVNRNLLNHLFKLSPSLSKFIWEEYS